MDLCFNELSLPEQCPEGVAVQKLNGLLDVLRKAYEIDRMIPTFRTENGFKSIEVSREYPVAKWLGNLEREKRQFMVSVADRFPYIDEKDTVAYAQYYLSDFRSDDLEEKEAKGLGAAWLLDGIAVSFFGMEQWNHPLIHIQQRKMDDNTDIAETMVEVRNAVSSAHMELHREYYRGVEYCERQLGKLDQLKDSGEKIFPALVFGDMVYDWLDRSNLSVTAFRRIIRHLYRLNRFFEDGVSRGNCDLRILPHCSGESESTRNQFSSAREFLIHGREYDCEWHLKIIADNIRIHFFPDFENRKVYVGYIGRHLPTSQYRT